MGLKNDQDYRGDYITTYKWDITCSYTHLLDIDETRIKDSTIVFENDDVTIYDYNEDAFLAVCKRENGSMNGVDGVVECIFNSIPLKLRINVNKFNKVPKSIKVYESHHLDNYTFKQNLEFYDLDGPDACIAM